MLLSTWFLRCHSQNLSPVKSCCFLITIAYTEIFMPLSCLQKETLGINGSAWYLLYCLWSCWEFCWYYWGSSVQVQTGNTSVYGILCFLCQKRWQNSRWVQFSQSASFHPFPWVLLSWPLVLSKSPWFSKISQSNWKKTWKNVVAFVHRRVW